MIEGRRKAGGRQEEGRRKAGGSQISIASDVF